MEHFDDISLKRLAEILFKHISFIIAFTLFAGILSFVYSEVVLVPQYQSSVTMYVINEKESNNQKTFSSDIQTAKLLVDTYKVIIKSDTVLKEVSKKLAEKGLTYSADALRGGITANAVDSTEIFEVKVKCTDPKDAYTIANVIADVAPAVIKDFVEASSVKIIDYAVKGKQVSPNVQRNMIFGLLIGLFLSCLFVVLRELFDTRIKSEDALEQWFEYPILAVIPEISDSLYRKSNTYYAKNHSKNLYDYSSGEEVTKNGGKTN